MKALAADEPRLLGEYRLRGRLGEGGMGRVYLGLSPGGRAVAIKVVRPELASDIDFLRRFQQEVASARAVSGIYTAPVVATGLDDYPPWLATAYVPGPSLAQVVKEHGPLPESALRPLLAGLVEALQAIHARGVVHRDLKPPNVLLAADGPRVIDFGISRAIESAAVTATGAVFGTPSYMSPEQAEGKPGDPASDVFALGCVMAYAATGAPPFGEGTPASVLYRVVHGEAALGGIVPWLRDLITGCLAKDPAERPAPQALAAAMARGEHGTEPWGVSFWPPPVARLINAYQPRLEAQAAEGAPDEGAFTTYGMRGAAERSQGNPVTKDHRESQDVTTPSGGAKVLTKIQEPYRRLVPDSVRDAVRLMYTGAAYAVIYAVCAVLIIDGTGNPFASLTLRSEVSVAGITCAVQVTLWLWMAWACRKAKNWARIASTVLFALYTMCVLVVLLRYRHYAAGGIGTMLIGVTWLIAGGSVLLLWQRQSSAFFQGELE
jgi:serine/threonine protein kinase